MENKSYLIENDVIVIDRDLNSLDVFVRDFLRVLRKYSDYLIVSGFVSISTGRTRGTENVDCLVKEIGRDRFAELFEDLKKSGFWCYQGDSLEEVWRYVEKGDSIRLARNDEIFPNMEFIFVNSSRVAKYFELTHPQKIRVRDFEFLIPPIEFEILYKEMVLKGDKDVADAVHLREFFSEYVREEKFEEYRKIIEGELR